MSTVVDFPKKYLLLPRLRWGLFANCLCYLLPKIDRCLIANFVGYWAQNEVLLFVSPKNIWVSTQATWHNFTQEQHLLMMMTLVTFPIWVGCHHQWYLDKTISSELWLVGLFTLSSHTGCAHIVTFWPFSDLFYIFVNNKDMTFTTVPITSFFSTNFQLIVRMARISLVNERICLVVSKSPISVSFAKQDVAPSAAFSLCGLSRCRRVSRPCDKNVSFFFLKHTCFPQNFWFFCVIRASFCQTCKTDRNLFESHCFNDIKNYIEWSQHFLFYFFFISHRFFFTLSLSGAMSP